MWVASLQDIIFIIYVMRTRFAAVSRSCQLTWDIIKESIKVSCL